MLSGVEHSDDHRLPAAAGCGRGDDLFHKCSDPRSLFSSPDERQNARILRFRHISRLSLGPVLGGVLNHNFGWRSVFYVTTALAAAIAALSVFKLQEPRSLPAGEEDVQTGTGGRSDKKSEVNTPDDREKKKSSGNRKKTVAKQMDLPGCFLYSATLACIMYGFSSITSSLAAKILLPLGILLLICFLRRETRTEDPLIRLDMFRKNIVFSFSNIAALLNYGASYAVSYLLSIYLQTG